MKLSIKYSLPLLLVLNCFGCGEPAPKRNVILITMDTTRADYLSCYGGDSPKGDTPVMDSIAQDGTRFDLAMATAAVTPVSHASILTGLFNRDHGLRVIDAGSGFRLAPEVPTLATQFSEQGYKTIAIHSAFPVSPYFGLGSGFDVMESIGSKHNGPPKPGETRGPNTRRSDDTMDIVVEQLKQTEGPFFLWIHLWDPHDTSRVPPEEWLPPKEEVYVTDAAGNLRYGPSGNPMQLPGSTAIYASEVRYMDNQIGRMVQQLKDDQRWDNTILAITADHGEGLTDHDWTSHRILYQEQIRVPLIMRVPGVTSIAEVDALVRTVDISPTLLDYTGSPIPADLSGRSLRPLMESKSDAPRLTFAEQINGYDLNARMVQRRPQDDFSYCAMDVDWKLIWRPNHPQLSELFHIAKDPGELQNLWDWKHPEAVRLKMELAAHDPWVTAPFPKTGDAAAANAASKALEALGYAGGGEDEGDTGNTGPKWEFVCSRHYKQRKPSPGQCNKCERTMILIAQGK